MRKEMGHIETSLVKRSFSVLTDVVASQYALRENRIFVAMMVNDRGRSEKKNTLSVAQ